MGAFNGTLDVATDLLWTNSADAAVVTRGSGFTVRWSGGDPTQLVSISGGSSTLNQDGSISFNIYTCYANNSAGQFAIPANILTQIPASVVTGSGAAATVSRGTMSLGTTGFGTRFTASGVDYFTATNTWNISTSTQYK